MDTLAVWHTHSGASGDCCQHKLIKEPLNLNEKTTYGWWSESLAHFQIWNSKKFLMNWREQVFHLLENFIFFQVFIQELISNVTGRSKNVQSSIPVGAFLCRVDLSVWILQFPPKNMHNKLTGDSKSYECVQWLNDCWDGLQWPSLEISNG